MGHDSVVEAWVTNIVNANFNSMDPKHIHDAKNRIIDIVGCSIGGAMAPGCDMIRALARHWGGGECRASVIGFENNNGISTHDAAMVNSVMARSFDFGVLLPYIEGKFHEAHISETTVPVALALAEEWHRTGKEMITALILGDDIASRLIAASNYIPGLNWDSTGTVNRFGATAVAGNLLRLTDGKMRSAFGIILDQLSGSFQGILEGVHSFKLTQAMSARDGIIAVELADQGWLGSAEPILGRYGYFKLFCSGEYDTTILTKDLGKVYYADSIFKPYPCCRQMHIFIDCALQAVTDKEDLSPAGIETVTVLTSPRVASGPLNSPFTIGEFPQGSAIFSIKYNVANVLLRKCVRLEHYTEDFIKDPQIKELTGKICVIPGEISAEESLDVAELIVKMRDGEEFSVKVHYAKGHPLVKPLTQKEIEDKFRANIAFTNIISMTKAEEALDMLKHLENIDDVSAITNMLH